ncbi:MAG: hypothetical protein RBR95_05800 [Ignavibacteriaceae bacterium]|jgi:hypothetical protein|nr:hypothetical protein [Ignavibacteriaceae bacterium]
MKIIFLLMFLLIISQVTLKAQNMKPSWMDNSVNKLSDELLQKYGESQKIRIESGLKQVAEFWRLEDGDDKNFKEFVLTNFAGDQSRLDALFNRYLFLLEKIDGHMLEIGRNFRLQTDLDLGPIYPFDEIFAAYNPAAHVNDDLFKNKIAFIALLNFPLKSIKEKTTEGKNWTRRQWAEVRLAERFSKRIPADILQKVSVAGALSDQYIAEYNIFMYNLLNEKNERLFPKGMRLLSHWNLRDEIKANYQNDKNGLEKQRMIRKVMERIVDQSIPEIVINNPNYDWNPFSNIVTPSKEIDKEFPLVKSNVNLTANEPDTRYDIWLKTFLASKLMDPYSPTAPTHIERRFNEDRELSEARVKKMFEDLLSSPLAKDVAALIKAKLGRDLEPFDIWFNGFKPKGTTSVEELDEIVRQRYPNPDAFKEALPEILVQLGFTPERAKIIAGNIGVDPARGSGHAMGASMKEAMAYLRTRISKDGMDFKGFNIAIHELGHNVEQTISLDDIDYYTLAGVPNTAFTEAYAFTFQAKDLELLGFSSSDPENDALETINDFWQTFEIAGVSLVDMEVWHWMYDNPNATPAQLKQAVLAIAKNIWNKYYAQVIGVKDVTLLAVYSHMIHSFLYLPDYPIGHLIAHQIGELMKKSGSIGPEFERTARLGRISPDLWMQQATGSDVGADALIHATENAIKLLKK